jgi:hypothetical protein
VNGRQRARWAADILTDLQRLRKASLGRAGASELAKADEAIRAARAAALGEEGDRDTGRGEEAPGDGR